MILFLCMLVVLGIFLFQAKARIIMAEARKGTLLPAQKRRYYIVSFLLWALLTAVVMIFALSR